MAVFRICAGPHERERDGSGPRFIRRFICWKLESRCRPISTTTQTIDGHDKNRSPMPIDVFYRVVTGFPRERGRPTNNNNNNKETSTLVRQSSAQIDWPLACSFFFTGFLPSFVVISIPQKDETGISRSWFRVSENSIGSERVFWG